MALVSMASKWYKARAVSTVGAGQVIDSVPATKSHTCHNDVSGCCQLRLCSRLIGYVEA